MWAVLMFEFYRQDCKNLMWVVLTFEFHHQDWKNLSPNFFFLEKLELFFLNFH